ncbi:MAG: hypothetical protein Kow00114_32840 [Kiloniellaceae bacterium]
MPQVRDLQSDLFAAKNAFDAVATIIAKKIEDLTPEDAAFRQLDYLTRHGLADLQRALDTTGAADPAAAAERRAAELLDQAVTAWLESYAAAHLHEDYDHPDAKAADRREKEAEAGLMALDAAFPGVAAAQLAFQLLDGESGDSLFDGYDAVDFLDFAKAAGEQRGLPVQQAAAKVVAGYLAANPLGPLASVIEGHRQRRARRRYMAETLAGAIAERLRQTGAPAAAAE